MTLLMVYETFQSESFPSQIESTCTAMMICLKHPILIIRTWCNNFGNTCTKADYTKLNLKRKSKNNVK